MIASHCKSCPSKERSEELYAPDNGETFSLRLIVYAFCACEHTAPIPDRLRCFTSLFLLEYIFNLILATICVQSHSLFWRKIAPNLAAKPASLGDSTSLQALFSLVRSWMARPFVVYLQLATIFLQHWKEPSDDDAKTGKGFRIGNIPRSLKSVNGIFRSLCNLRSSPANNVVQVVDLESLALLQVQGSRRVS